MTKKKDVSEEQHLYKDLDDNKINYFPNGIIKEFITGQSILKYKLAMYWIPLLFYIIIMFIIVNTLFESAVFDDNITKTEIVGTVIAGVVIFICYFLVDFIYQLQLCKDQNIGEDVKEFNCKFLQITVVVTMGYLLGMFLNDSIMDDFTLAQQGVDKHVNTNNSINSSNNFIPTMRGPLNQGASELYDNQEEKQELQQDLLKLMLSSSQHNNIFMSILFYFIGMAYWNPYYDEKCSQTKICKKKRI